MNIHSFICYMPKQPVHVIKPKIKYILKYTQSTHTIIVLYRRFNIGFYQRVSIASYASAGIARGGMSVCLSVRPSVRHTPVLYQNEES